MTRILGIDPGSLATGYGIIDQDGQQLTYVASGCIRAKGESLAERLGIIFAGVNSIIHEFLPQEMARRTAKDSPCARMQPLAT